MREPEIRIQHVEFLRKTPLAGLIKEYSYFSYNANEALHLSEQERRTVVDCLTKIKEELQYPVDKHSKSLIADRLCLSPNYLSDLLKKKTGESALKHIQQKTLEMAKEHVSGTRKSVSEIAYELGFQYPQHFSRWFKKQTGVTPNEYRITN